MVDDGIRNMIISFILVGLFALAFISFIYQTSIDNNPTSDLLTNSQLNKTFKGLNSTLSSYQQQAEFQKNVSFSENTNPFVAIFELAVTSIIGIGRTFTGMIFGTWDLITGLIFVTLGVPPIVIGVILSIIIITVIFLLFRMWRVGS